MGLLAGCTSQPSCRRQLNPWSVRRMELTALEKAVLSRMASSNLHLDEALSSVTATRREMTGVGSYTHLDKVIDPPGASPIPGPSFESPDVEHGGGSLLWVSEGKPAVLELYAHGSFFRASVRAFELKT